ncbi:MAG: citramalate synthase, partial [Pelagibacterales bacterium]|nr:citramalate synthase [Pelagibacterales bacterium]
MTRKPRVYLYDSTLRDGAQTSTVNFGVRDKIEIAKIIDSLGIDYVEGGWPGANPTDDEFFSNLPKLKKSKFSAFGMTKRSGVSATNDTGLNALINSDTKSVCIVGKTWDFHLKNALHISEAENLDMISDSIQHIVKKKKEAMFDAEHFFDGYKANPKFALKAIKTAFESGARWIILCDTNGGTLPSEISKIVKDVTKHIPGENLGIHCHNDTGNAVANSLAAVESGVRQIQGTINGLGERCGNANLISIIPTLCLKMGFDVGISEEQLKNLVHVSNFLDDLLNKERDKFAPYVGKYAFAHKGGLHVSAVAKNPTSYEHVQPEKVGNQRQIMISDQAGRSNIISRLKEIGIELKDEIKTSQVANLVNQVKELEAK